MHISDLNADDMQLEKRWKEGSTRPYMPYKKSTLKNNRMLMMMSNFCTELQKRSLEMSWSSSIWVPFKTSKNIALLHIKTKTASKSHLRFKTMSYNLMKSLTALQLKEMRVLWLIAAKNIGPSGGAKMDTCKLPRRSKTIHRQLLIPLGNLDQSAHLLLKPLRLSQRQRT